MKDKRPTPRLVIAALKEMSLVSERAQRIDGTERVADAKMSAKADLESGIGAALSKESDRNDRLVITHTYKVNISEVGTGNPLCEYESEIKALFSVEGVYGFDRSKDELPLEAVTTYINQVVWQSRSRATATIAAMGFSGFRLPMPEGLMPEEVDEPAKPAQKRARKRAVRTT